MLHRIQTEKYGPAGEVMAHEIKACVHCGFCLPVCPTYKVLGEEMDSPRGRIFLMKEVLEGNLDLESAMPFIDRCLGCVGCVTACPSGVQYGELVTPFRAHAEKQRDRRAMDRLNRTMMGYVLPYPSRFRVAARLGRLALPLKKVLPRALGAMLELLPNSLPASQPLPEVFPAQGERRGRVALLSGCVQQVLAPEINWATLRVLSRNGIEVVIPRRQGCCGALAMHTGQEDQARQLARANLSAFPTDVDALITNAAGCGSGMKEYGLLFKGESQEEEATTFASRVRDVCQYLHDVGLRALPEKTLSLKVAYHDACHLAHAQGVREAPRQLLGRVPGVEIVEIPDGEICCGSAGTYNIDQPEIAARLGEEKALRIQETGAEAVAAGNIGCLIQIQSRLQSRGHPLPVYHTLEILDRAYGARVE